ncbi:MAG TPA: hypothetical protein VFT37_14170 [Telluria sp.]|nr:hypothetical protein [Telluria sp.]
MSNRFTSPWFVACFCGALVLLMKVTAPSGGEADRSPEYQAACHGPPLGTIAKRYKAQEDGYFVNTIFDRIDKADYLAVEKARAEYAAANTPEAIAQAKAEFAASSARMAEERDRKEAEDAALKEATRPRMVLRPVDVNTGSEQDLAEVISLDSTVAAQIVAERTKRRFANWDDLVGRVVGLSAAQSAVEASICGLTVNGTGMYGAPLNADMAATIYERRHDQRPIISLAPAGAQGSAPAYQAPGPGSMYAR